MSKISEILSKRRVTIDLLGEKVTFSKFNLSVIAKYERDGFSLKDVLEKMNEKPVLWGTTLAWDLMTEDSKNIFENNVEMFRECLDPQDVEMILKLISGVLLDSLPVESKKKEEIIPEMENQNSITSDS